MLLNAYTKVLFYVHLFNAFFFALTPLTNLQHFLINALSFSVYHFWSIYFNFLGFFLMKISLSIYAFLIYAHVSINTTSR